MDTITEVIEQLRAARERALQQWVKDQNGAWCYGFLESAIDGAIARLERINGAD